MTHPYELIAEHYRRLIRDGELPEGARLPSLRQLAEEHSVAIGTIRNALSWLQVEGYIRTSARGTFVNDEPPTMSAPADRLSRLHRIGSVLSKGESKIVTSASLVVPPLYVAEILDLDEGDQVVRREWTTGKAQRRLSLCVTWYPAPFAIHVPDLLSIAPGKCDDAVKLIQVTTGRTVAHWRDAMHARDADEREASHLGLPVGSSILAMAWEWSDDQGVIEYGEACLPPRMTVGYGDAPEGR
jgi:GntR family transcriptional regulator